MIEVFDDPTTLHDPSGADVHFCDREGQSFRNWEKLFQKLCVWNIIAHTEVKRKRGGCRYQHRDKMHLQRKRDTESD